MIARIWHGSTKLSDKDEYTQFMLEKAVPDYKSTKGFVKLSFLSHVVGQIAHSTLITYWENLEVIKTLLERTMRHLNTTKKINSSCLSLKIKSFITKFLRTNEIIITSLGLYQSTMR